nr:PREDICTED: 39S ribosomal protein L54, mitochondrial [Bemisia tabaci]
MFNLLRPVPILQKYITSCSVLPKAFFATDTLATAALGKAKKKTAGKAAGSSEKIRLPVETDTNRLVNYVCGTNLLKEGGEDVKIGPDSDYPDWLFELYVGPAKKLSELEPGSLQYWRRINKLYIRKRRKESMLRKAK